MQTLAERCVECYLSNSSIYHEDEAVVYGKIEIKTMG